MSQVDALVGERLRALRCSKSLSQIDLARAVGVTFQQIQKYENGTKRVKASRLFAFAQALEVPVSHFFEDIEVEQAGSSVQEQQGGNHSVHLVDLLSDAKFLSFAQEFIRLPQGQRNAVVALVRSLADQDLSRVSGSRAP
jgi:transcriptional regulator with XRE-family HTH domain